VRPRDGSPPRRDSRAARRRALRRRRRRAAAVGALILAAAASIGWLIGAPGGGRALVPARAPTRPLASDAAQVSTPAQALPGALLIADRGNDRILLVDALGRVLWRFPTGRDLALGRRLRFNDDAFVAAGGQAIVANEEEAHTIVRIDIRTHARTHLYGLPGVRGAGPGLLNTPDDAYPLVDGSVVVADAYNCRILFIRSHRILRQLGQTGVCHHDPPRSFGAVNGDTPVAGGGLLVSEIPGHWVDRISADGRLAYAVKAPVSYPSDPQPLPGDRILLADYADPGQVVIIDRRGRVLWRYGPTAGPGRLDHPSLAIELPNGNIAVNDDYRHRVVVIDPRLGRIVWQYGFTDRAGRGARQLNTPDGMDYVPLRAGAPDWAAVHHP